MGKSKPVDMMEEYYNLPKDSSLRLLHDPKRYLRLRYRNRRGNIIAVRVDTVTGKESGSFELPFFHFEKIVANPPTL